MYCYPYSIIEFWNSPRKRSSSLYPDSPKFGLYAIFQWKYLQEDKTIIVELGESQPSALGLKFYHFYIELWATPSKIDKVKNAFFEGRYLDGWFLSIQSDCPKLSANNIFTFLGGTVALKLFSFLLIFGIYFMIFSRQMLILKHVIILKMHFFNRFSIKFVYSC